jgi:hypothetical protein
MLCEHFVIPIGEACHPGKKRKIPRIPGGNKYVSHQPPVPRASNRRSMRRFSKGLLVEIEEPSKRGFDPFVSFAQLLTQSEWIPRPNLRPALIPRTHRLAEIAPEDMIPLPKAKF